MHEFWYYVCPDCTTVFKSEAGRGFVLDNYNAHKCSPVAGKTMSVIEEREWAVTQLECMGGVPV